MRAATAAATLRRLGFPVKSITEGDDGLDGEVTINAFVHVQVPTYGPGVCVVEETDRGTFKFYPPRRSVPALADDLRQALATQQGAA